MKGIKHECQLMERCDGHDHGGGVRELWKVVRRLSGGVTVVRNLVQLIERYDGHGGDVRGYVWERVTVFRNCDSPQ